MEMQNPLMLASGIAGYGDDLKDVVDLGKIGAIVTKTITIEPRDGNVPPRLAEAPSGLLNSIGLANIGCDAFISRRLGRLSKLKTKIIVSIGGFSPREYGEVASRLENAGGFEAFEINISCPNVREGGSSFCSSSSIAGEVVGIVRSRTKRLVLVKLSPNVTEVAAIARACVSEGADVLTVGNTFKAMAIDVQTRRPLLGAGTGGLSGPAIKALSLAKVWEVVTAVKVPVVACGGIASAEDVLEFIIAGATAFQVGSACLRSFRAPETILAGIREYCRKNGIGRISDLRGTLLFEEVRNDT